MQPHQPHHHHQQQQRIRLQALTQQQLGRFRQVQATRELCDQDADLAARLARRWAGDDDGDGLDRADQVESDGGHRGRNNEDNSLEDREADLLSQRRQLEDRLRQLGDEADRLRRRCASGEPAMAGGDFTLARRMQDAESQLAMVMSETEQADSSLARCISELDECRWQRRRNERHQRRSRRRHRRRQQHRRRREEDQEEERHQRSRSVDAWVQTGRVDRGLAGHRLADSSEFNYQPGLPVVAPGSPIYDNPANSGPAAAQLLPGGGGGGGFDVGFDAPPSRFAHTRQSLRQAVTAAAAAASAAPVATNGAVPGQRPQSVFPTNQMISGGIDSSTNFVRNGQEQRPPQQPVRRQQQPQQHKQRPVSAFYFADSPLMSSRQPPQHMPPNSSSQSNQSIFNAFSTNYQHPVARPSRNVAADLDPTYFTTDDLVLSADVGYHLRRPQQMLPGAAAAAAAAAAPTVPHEHRQNHPAPVPGQRRSSASPVVLKSAARRQQQQQFASAPAAAAAPVDRSRSRSQCAQS